MAKIIITKDNFEAEVLQSKETVLLYFWAAWNGPCTKMNPILEEIAKERDDVKVAMLNVDDEATLAREFRSVSIPTVMVYKNGKKVDDFAGLRPKKRVLQSVDAD